MKDHARHQIICLEEKIQEIVSKAKELKIAELKDKGANAAFAEQLNAVSKLLFKVQLTVVKMERL